MLSRGRGGSVRAWHSQPVSTVPSRSVSRLSASPTLGLLFTERRNTAPKVPAGVEAAPNRTEAGWKDKRRQEPNEKIP